MKLSEMRRLLAEGDVRLTRSLGQNFLHDANQLRRIVASAQLTRADRVLEIGPGLGPLTEQLLEAAGEILAVEKDARLVDILRERFAGELEAASRFQLVHADALDFLRAERRNWNSWKLVANLPYSIASPLLVELARDGQGPARMVATLQLEVARRLMAPAGQSDYGVLSLLIQLQYEPLAWFKIPATCFFPEPDVDSACIALARREQPLLSAGEVLVFERIVKRSFSQRRKMMFKLLRNDWAPATLERAFGCHSLAHDTRAESVKLEQFVGLARMLSADSGSA